MIAVVLFFVVYGAIGVVAMRRRLLGRLAFRSAVRRPGQSVLVVAGLMIGSAAITASLIGADSTEASSVANTYRGWGLVDYTITAPNDGSMPAAHATALARALGDDADGVVGGIEVVAGVADLDRRQGESGVSLIGFDAATQSRLGGFRFRDGGRSTGADLGVRDIVLSATLADALDARDGDTVRITVGSSSPAAPLVLRVAGIAHPEEFGSYTLGKAVFAPLPLAQRITGMRGINIIRVSAPGGIEPTRDTFDAVRVAVAAIDPGLRPNDSKTRDIAAARENTRFIRSMLVAMSILVMAAGGALVVNLIAMLAEERRTQLGVLRALGLTRRNLVTLSVIEGALYSVGAAIVGTGIGILAGRFVAARFGKAFNEFSGGDFDFRFSASIQGRTVATAFALGAVLTLLVVFLSARRTARMNIPSAIRNLPERARRRGRHPVLRIALVALGAIGLAGAVGANDLPRIAGGIAFLAAVASFTRGRINPRVHATVGGLVLTAWALSNVVSQDPNESPDTFFPVFVLAMLSTVFGLSISVIANLTLVERAVGLLGHASSGARATLRPPLAYLARRGMRTGLTTGVFALILGMLTLFAVFMAIFRPDYEATAGGYDVRVAAAGLRSITIPEALQDDARRIIEVPSIGYVGSFASPDAFAGGDRIHIPIYEMGGGDRFPLPVKLDGSIDTFTSDEQAWRAVRGDVDAIRAAGDDPLACPKGRPAPRATAFVMSNFASIGNCLTLQGRDGPVTLRVAGNQSFGVFDGIIGSPATLAAFGGFPRGAIVLADLKPGVSATRYARDAERALFAGGVDAQTIRVLLDDSYRANRTFFSVIQVLIQMGLVVGILALGIVALRTIVERRHVIGVLRAIGYQRWQVMTGLMAEAALTTLIGVLIGMAAGSMMGYMFYRQIDVERAFAIEWSTVGVSVLVVYIAVTVVTLGPSWRASRLPPAEAVRYIE